MDATDLERWADQRSAQSDLPRLVRRLIRHENDQVQSLEMRGGEGVGLPGYDGTVEATRATPFVPDGLSVWEMGTSDDPAGKATDDYKSRTDDSLDIDKSEATFVFVTPRRWRRKKAWEAKRRAEGKWRDVRVLDADDIEQALEEAPAVRIWMSELLDMPALGVATIEDWWRRFSNGFDPKLTANVVLAGREDSAAMLLRRLAIDVGRTFIKAASVDDGLAFAACAMMAQAPDESEPMLSRSLLVHDGVTLRRLDSTSSLLILLPYEEHLQREASLVENHHVAFVVTEGDADIELPPLDHRTLRTALHEVGVLEGDLDRFVRAGTKSLLALRRVSTRFGQIDPADWYRDLSDAPVRRAWLAGAWSQRRSGDREVMEALTGTSQVSLTDKLESIVSQPDPIFTQVGGTWAVASVEDSWRSARHTIRDADLMALELAVQTVLGAVDPRLELPPEERWTAGIYGKSRVHSTDLRSGLGRAVALLGARGDELRLGGGRSARQWAERVVWRLVSRANEDKSAQLWESMSDVLPLLAEAAPDVFLRSAADAASGAEPLARHYFQDETDSWYVSSPHTGVLWALECIAWSSRHLGFAAEVLAMLAEIDPGGRLSNRPASSLREIFRPWLPQTSAPAGNRVLVIDALLLRHEAVTWNLMLELLPGPSEVAMPTHKPRFRDWAAGSGRAATTYGEIYEFIDALSERIIEHAARDPLRWVEVVKAFDRLPNEGKRSALERLGQLERDELDPSAIVSLWGAIEDFVRKHRQFADSRWSLAEEWLEPLAARAAALAPSAPAETRRWLFDDWSPDIGVSMANDYAGYEETLTKARVEAAKAIIDAQGFGALPQLACEVALPSAVGLAAAAAGPQFEAEALINLDSDDPKRAEFASGYARARFGGDIEQMRPWLERLGGNPLAQARLLQSAGNVIEAWGVLAELGRAVEEAYWKEFVPYGRGADFSYVNEVARNLLTHGRAAVAVDALSIYADRQEEIAVDVVVDALQAFTGGENDAGRVSEHDLSRLLAYLRSRDVDEALVAQLEWKFLPVLHHGEGAPSLQRLLARDPASFVKLIELAFKRASSGGEDEGPVDSNLAGNAYRLLREWRVVPGSTPDGGVDGTRLRGWIDAARTSLVEIDRLDIGELQIGEVFAHAPTDPDGTFPTRAVRDVLEVAPTDHLERGFIVGLHNKRGVTSRGMTEGGKQEFDIAAEYDDQAARIEATHPRTAGALRAVADSYREEGRRNDEEARRFLEGLEF
ncbi:hypothetical protein [Agromyces tropicus]|uniref:hypothetical protein n=1 Tax=Agromyces tropicus TaxID=555371 RepID=UPI0031E031B9